MFEASSPVVHKPSFLVDRISAWRRGITLVRRSFDSRYFGRFIERVRVERIEDSEEFLRRLKERMALRDRISRPFLIEIADVWEHRVFVSDDELYPYSWRGVKLHETDAHESFGSPSSVQDIVRSEIEKYVRDLLPWPLLVSYTVKEEEEFEIRVWGRTIRYKRRRTLKTEYRHPK